MLDERGFDYGLLTGVGLAIASAIVLLFIFSTFRTTGAADRTIALESAASGVCGDIETVASMAIPYSSERYYAFEGIDVSVSQAFVNASSGKDAFLRPVSAPVVPGRYEKNGSVLWNGSAGLREYMNATFNATGTKDRPLDNASSASLRRLMDRAGEDTLYQPIEVPHSGPTIIEKIFIYLNNGTEAEPYVLVYPG